MTQLLGNANTVKFSYTESVAEGHPPMTTGVHPLDEVAGAPMGVWEAPKPGVFIGAPPAVEIFVVLSGSVTVSNAGDGASVTAAQGDIVRLASGVEVRWDVPKAVRIFYVLH